MDRTSQPSIDDSKYSIHDSEKRTGDSIGDGVDLSVGDEALKLVGKERTVQFTEEYNARIRRKLVRCRHPLAGPSLLTYFPQDLTIPPLCAAVYFTQYLCVV